MLQHRSWFETFQKKSLSFYIAFLIPGHWNLWGSGGSSSAERTWTCWRMESCCAQPQCSAGPFLMSLSGRPAPGEQNLGRNDLCQSYTSPQSQCGTISEVMVICAQRCGDGGSEDRTQLLHTLPLKIMGVFWFLTTFWYSNGNSVRLHFTLSSIDTQDFQGWRVFLTEK